MVIDTILFLPRCTKTSMESRCFSKHLLLKRFRQTYLFYVCCCYFSTVIGCITTFFSVSSVLLSSSLKHNKCSGVILYGFMYILCFFNFNELKSASKSFFDNESTIRSLWVLLLVRPQKRHLWRCTRIE